MRSLLILCLVAATAHADPVVLAVDGGNIYVDLGAKDGVGAGSKLELLHAVIAKDPRTGRVLEDHFALGTLVVDRAGDSLAVAHADKDLLRRILTGDDVRLMSSKKHFVDPFYAVRLGFGTLSGTGGPKDVINADPTGCMENGVYKCRHVEFTYVYTELEHALAPSVHVMLRPQVGHLPTDSMPGSDGSRCHGRAVTGCELATGFGAKLGLRLGDEQGTNLAIGAAFTEHVGTLLEAVFHWLPAPVVPVQVMVQVTAEPVPQDFGVRLIGDVGYHAGGWFYPSVRVSSQARAITPAGFSGGAAK